MAKWSYLSIVLLMVVPTTVVLLFMDIFLHDLAKLVEVGSILRGTRRLCCPQLLLLRGT